MAESMTHLGKSGASASAWGWSWGSSSAQAPPRRCAAFLYRVAVYDVPTILIVMPTLVAVTLLATPAPLRIARINPAKTLRGE
jgi:hypothetical protein